MVSDRAGKQPTPQKAQNAHTAQKALCCLVLFVPYVHFVARDEEIPELGQTLPRVHV